MHICGIDPMDLFVIHGIVEELKKEIGGAFISKIYQMNRTDLLFRLRRPGDEKSLLFSTHPDFFRLHLTEKKYANPLIPPRFCTYLRKHIGGSRISGVTQDPFERVVRLHIQKKMDAGVVRELALVVELVGKMSNVLLLEGGQILDCLHFRRVEEGPARPSAPGLAYVPLSPPGQWTPEELDLKKVEEVCASPAGERWKTMAREITGLSPLLAREIEFTSDGTPEGIWEKLRLFFERYERGTFEPRIYTLLGEKKVLSPFPLKSLGPAEEEAFLSLNRAADHFYFETVVKRRVTEQKRALSKRLRQLISRLERRRENLSSDREGFQKDLESKDWGEILTANYPKLKKGMREIEALDYRQDPPQSILIPLDESLDPSANVQRYFKKYKKAKRGLEMTSRRMEEAEREIGYLESVLFEVEAAEDAEEVETVRQELEEGRIIRVPGKQKSGKEKMEISLPVRRFRSSDGLEIFCGKHNVGNDYLLRHLAEDHDLWFHSQGVPGSHVLLKTGRGEPKQGSILEAATIAAFYSRGRGSTRLPVDYTPVKNVHRPRGAKPGMVTYFHQKTLVVKPDAEKVEKMKA
jgi:predicted ribosome quality control (RQC) complex YloA/Tae2 family protein